MSLDKIPYDVIKLITFKLNIEEIPELYHTSKRYQKLRKDDTFWMEYAKKKYKIKENKLKTWYLTVLATGYAELKDKKKLKTFLYEEINRETDLKRIRNILKVSKMITGVNRHYGHTAYEEENKNINAMVDISGDTITYNGIKPKELIKLLLEEGEKEARKIYREDYMEDIENNLDPGKYDDYDLGDKDEKERDLVFKDNLEEDIKSLDIHILDIRYAFYNDTFYISLIISGVLFVEESYYVVTNIKLKIKGEETKILSSGGVSNSLITNFLFVERLDFETKFKSITRINIGIRVDYQYSVD